MTSDKRDYSDLIPEYQQGLLGSHETTAFEQELSSNSILQQELKEFREFQQLYGELDSDAPQPDETQFKAILSAIDKPPELQPCHKQHHAPQGISNPLITLWEFFKNSVTVPWGMALMQTAVIIILLIPGKPPVPLKTLSRSSDTGTALTQISFNIVFVKTAQEEEIRNLLLDLGATIISGPSPQGLYVIALSSDTPTELAVQKLNESQIVTFSKRAY